MSHDDDHIETNGGCPPTPEEAARNEPLLAGYDYSKYPEGITGFNGLNLQRITACRSHPAVRVRVGPRGNYKGAITAYLNEPPAPPGVPRSACEVVRWRIPDA